jgi:hypothetical protein
MVGASCHTPTTSDLPERGSRPSLPAARRRTHRLNTATTLKSSTKAAEPTLSDTIRVTPVTPGRRIPTSRIGSSQQEDQLRRAFTPLVSRRTDEHSWKE